jgi:hypothetical protein
MRAPRFLCAWHHKGPVVFSFTGIDNRNYISHTIEVYKQKLARCTRRLRHQFDYGRFSLWRFGRVDLPKASAANAVAKDPFVRKF